MQIVSPGAIDAAAAEPLLSRPHAAAAAGGNILVAAHAPSDPAPEPAKALQPQPLHFRRRFAALLALLRPWPALALSALAIIEALVVAEGAWVSDQSGQAGHLLLCCCPLPLLSTSNSLATIAASCGTPLSSPTPLPCCPLPACSRKGGGILLQDRRRPAAFAASGSHGARGRAVCRLHCPLLSLVLGYRCGVAGSQRGGVASWEAPLACPGRRPRRVREMLPGVVLQP